MSVEKLTKDSTVNQELIPFTQVSNNVINNIKDGTSFLVWCYLLSKTGNWKVIKQNIKNQYSIGNTKLKKIFSYLNRSNLIQYVQKKDSNNCYIGTDIEVLNGINFDINQSYISNKEESLDLFESGGSESRPPESRATGNGKLLNKDLTKQTRSKAKSKDIATPFQKNRTSISSSFVPNEYHKQIASDFNVFLEEELILFKDHFEANGKKMINWNAAFNNWLRRAAKFKSQVKNKTSNDSYNRWRTRNESQGNIYEGEVI